jgi:hypothetical protein
VSAHKRRKPLAATDAYWIPFFEKWAPNGTLIESVRHVSMQSGKPIDTIRYHINQRGIKLPPRKNTTVEIRCKNCNKRKGIPLCHLNPRGNFCSRQCDVAWRKANSNKIVFICDNPACNNTHSQNPAKYKVRKHHYCSAKCRAADLHKFGKGAFAWRGGKTRSAGGYIYINVFGLVGRPQELAIQSLAGNKQPRYIAEHRLRMAIYLDRPLISTEHVHHRNGIKDDNRIENLVITPIDAHTQTHAQKVIEIGELRAENERLRQQLTTLQGAPV